MGILSNLTGSGRGGSSIEGGHGINSSSLLAPTNPNALSPTNPGNLTNVRTHKIVDQPRFFTKEQADQLCTNEALASYILKHTKRAFGALGRQEGNDAELQQTYRTYQTRVATAEAKKVRSNANYGKVLQGMRAGYAQLGYGYQQVEMAATQRVTEIKARLAGIR